jgi:hypothetical protein
LADNFFSTLNITVLLLPSDAEIRSLWWNLSLALLVKLQIVPHENVEETVPQYDESYM